MEVTGNRSQYWDSYWKIDKTVPADNVIDSLPLFEKGLWQLFSIVGLTFVATSLINYDNKSITRRFRPYLFIYYSFMCGVYGAGLFLGAIVSNGYENLVTCQKVVSWTEMEFTGVIRIYITYIAVIFKFINIMEAVLMRKGRWLVFFHSFELMGGYIIIRYHLHDNLAFSIFTHIMLLSWHYFYKIIQVSGKDEKLYSKSKPLMLNLMIVVQSAMYVSQGAYYLMTPNCHIPQNLALIEIFYGIITFVFSKYAYN